MVTAFEQIAETLAPGKDKTEIGQQINALRRSMMAQIATGVPDRNMTGDISALAALYWCQFYFDWDEAMEQAITFVKNARAGR